MKKALTEGNAWETVLASFSVNPAIHPLQTKHELSI